MLSRVVCLLALMVPALVTAARIHNHNESRAFVDTGRCSKVQAIYICKLASQGWHAEEHKGYKKDDLKCIGSLCNQNVGRCCEKRKELMSAPTNLPAEDMPLDEAGLANFDKYDFEKVGVPTNANDHGEKPEEPVLEPTCPTGNIPITFGDYTVQTYVPRGKHAGDIWEGECGYGAVDSKAKFKLVCKLGELDDDNSKFPKWQLVEGQDSSICQKKVGCAPTNFQMIVPLGNHKEKSMKFSLPFQQNNFNRKVAVDFPCPKDNDIIGGNMEWICNPNGKWSKGEHKCEYAAEVMAPARVPSKPAGPGPPAKPAGGKTICNPARFQLTVGDKRLPFTLPAAKAGEEVTQDCGTGMCGHATFKCDGDASKWSLDQEMSSCRMKGACAATNFGLTFGEVGHMNFKLPGGQRDQEVSLPCPSPAKWGTVGFQCRTKDKESDDECQEHTWTFLTEKAKCKK